jgi:hypothetical protein
MENRFHPATSAVASRDMPPTARMRASTIRNDSVSVVLPRLKNRQDHRFLGATSINGNLCTLRPLRLPFCQPAGQCLVSSNVRSGDKRTGARERSKYRLDERLGLLSQIEIQAW